MKSAAILGLLFCSLSALAFPMDGLVDLSNKPAQFQTDKNVELVVFWATWCPSCKSKISQDLPTLNKSKHVAVVLVNTEKDTERVKEFSKKQKIDLPVFVDSQKIIREKYNIVAVPSWLVFKRSSKDKPWVLAASGTAYDDEEVSKALNK